MYKLDFDFFLVTNFIKKIIYMLGPNTGVLTRNIDGLDEKEEVIEHSYYVYPNLRNLKYKERKNMVDKRKRYRKFIRPLQNQKTAPRNPYYSNEGIDVNSPSYFGRILYGFLPPTRYYSRPHSPQLTKEQRDEQFRKEYLRYISQDFPNFQLGSFDLGFGFF